MKLIKGGRPDDALLIPLLIWSSGKEGNIELCQDINKKVFNVNRKVLIGELSYNNTLKHFIKYPKVSKDDDKLKFFYDDIAKYFQWTPKEVSKNIAVIDIDELKPVIAKAFGYTNKERKVLGLPKLEGINNGKKRKTTKTKQFRKIDTEGRDNREGI
ncbi:hypothetical protein [Oceanihabitans sediminis]|uniref:hypothetical protein n=1 Tax=Oceanihabitans sediminis TaxID=1812012 RepID=UPI00299DE615|nr:hypothetical protein [Oceanihabitans sediminis]MDX1279025.1 hypothetical protein [Oceanihabitans sediminis]